jgi:hypothetical protein
MSALRDSKPRNEKKMRKLLAVLILAGCTSAQADSPTIIPLSQTSMSYAQANTRQMLRSAEATTDFLDNFRSSYTGFKWLTAQQAVDWGYLWCNELAVGKSLEEVFDLIQHSTNSEEEEQMMKAVATMASFDLCPISN